MMYFVGLCVLVDVASVSMEASGPYSRKMKWSSREGNLHYSCSDGLGINISEMFDKVPFNRVLTRLIPGDTCEKA